MREKRNSSTLLLLYVVCLFCASYYNSTIRAETCSNQQQQLMHKKYNLRLLYSFIQLVNVVFFVFNIISVTKYIHKMKKRKEYICCMPFYICTSPRVRQTFEVLRKSAATHTTKVVTKCLESC